MTKIPISVIYFVIDNLFDTKKLNSN